ncbi:MAG: cardiolipin synthase [Verrucomicrobia bacterium]|nr:cardiolipin synthase [Verrucomicrobiota bacterium]
MKTEKKTKKRLLLGFYFVLAVLLVSGVYAYWFALKPIRKEIKVEYSIADPSFKQSLDGLLGFAFVGGNRITTLVNGDEIFPDMLEAIRGAQKSITLETYIWSDSEIGREFKKALSERAQAGVNVYVIVDGMGSIRLKQTEINLMRDAGIRFYKFNRRKWYSVNLQINHRTHRKIMIVDGKIGFIGGSCIHDSWLGDAETEDQWRDTHYRIEGPSITQMQGIFAENWRQTTGEILHGPDFFPRIQPSGNLLVQCYMSGPKDRQEIVRVSFLYSMSAAKKNIRIAHSYFFPDELTRVTLYEALKRGVEIEVIVPGKLDSKTVKAASRVHWADLMDAGVKFYEYGPAMYHVKKIIVDDELVIAGSANFDSRSFRINDEANFNVMDRQFAAEQIVIFEKDKAQCRQMSAAELRKRSVFVKAFDRIAGLFSSQF